MARAAYTTSPGACNGVAHSVDYTKGFEEGYYDVASGGDGCPPALPPKKYWRATYGSPIGQEHVDAWFQGFRDGAARARAEGAASFGVIRVAAEHRQGVERSKTMPRIVLPMTGPRVKPPPEAEPSIPSPPLPDAPPQPDPPADDPAREPFPLGRDRTPPPAPMPPKSTPRKEQPPEVPRKPSAVPNPTSSSKSPNPSPVSNPAVASRTSASSNETGTFRISLPKRRLE